MNGPETVTSRLQPAWDWPNRVFHWLLVLAITTFFITGNRQRSFAQINLHLV